MELFVAGVILGAASVVAGYLIAKSEDRK